jgi:hypothetical protein
MIMSQTRTRAALALLLLACLVAPAAAKPKKKSAPPAPAAAAPAAPAPPTADMDSVAMLPPLSPATVSDLPPGTEVKVERMRPEKEKVPTLRFLRENLDFIRAQFDRLREKPVEQHADASDIDPRLLNYSRLLAEALASRDTVGAAEDARARQHLLESIAQLGDLEAQLDLMEHHLDKQRIRLAFLEDDFTGQQQTALMVVLSGYPKDLAVSEVTVALDDGDPIHVTLSPEQCESLRRGGVVELFHGFAEPREQVIQVSLAAAGLPAGDPGFVTVSPMRDRLMFLRFDLSNVQPAQGGASVRASTWLHQAGAHPTEG